MHYETKCQIGTIDFYLLLDPIERKPIITQSHTFPHNPHPDALTPRQRFSEEAITRGGDIPLSDSIEQFELETAEQRHERDIHLHECETV